MDAHAQTSPQPGAGAPSARSLRIVRGATLQAAPWKNGGGVTREIAADPVGADLESFAWRVSVAEVERSGPFSRFAGVDRTLVLLAGAGMHLIEARGATHALMQPLAVAQFDGAVALDAQLVDGATRDFNLMVRRDRAHAALDIWEVRHASKRVLDADTVLIFCARGSLNVRFDGPAPGAADALQPQAALAQMDTLVVDGARSLVCELTGEGAAIVVQLRYLCSSSLRRMQ